MITVKLDSFTPRWWEILYCAYRVAYSSDQPEVTKQKIADGRISYDKMIKFIEDRLDTGHTSPLEQIDFVFTITGVTRAFSHQFVRTRVGFSPEQASQRYITFKGDTFPYTTPQSVIRLGKKEQFDTVMATIGKAYHELISAGVPGEDARALLPNATHTSLQVKINFQALANICDVRLCTRAQAEYRKVAALMRAEVIRAVPTLGKRLGIKCQAMRAGICDESIDAWKHCPIGGANPHLRGRPHKSMLDNPHWMMQYAAIHSGRPKEEK